MARVELERLLEARGGLVDPPACEVGDAEVVVGLEGIGVELENGAESALRLLGASQTLQAVAEAQVKEGGCTSGK